MIWQAARLSFGPMVRILFVLGAVSWTWMLWNWSPQRAIATVYEDREAWPRRDFGPRIGEAPRSMCGTFAASGLDTVEPDPTWLLRRQFNVDNSLWTVERGTGRVLCTLPAADYRWISGSRFNRRLGARSGDQFKVWDLENQKLLYSIPCLEGECGLTESGRHVFMYESNEYAIQIAHLERPGVVTRVGAGQRLKTPDGTGIIVQHHFTRPAFSPDGRWMALGVQDQTGRNWLHLWDLPANTLAWQRDLDSINRRSIMRPAFDASGRYFILGVLSSDILIDCGTVPPTDLSSLVQSTSVDTIGGLGDRRYVAHSDVEPASWRIWDLDRRQLIASHPAGHGKSSVFTKGRVLTPDNKLAMIQVSSDEGIMQYFEKLLVWLGVQSSNKERELHFLVIDMSNGQILNRITGGMPYQFDPQLQHVWMRRIQESMFVRDAFDCFPLRSAEPPWWMWTVAALGLCWVSADARRIWIRKRSLAKAATHAVA